MGMVHCVNVRAEDMTTSLRQLRQAAGPSGKVLVHYCGHGVSRPRGNHIYLQGSSSSGDSVKYTLDAVRANAQYPLIFVADCPSAGTILNNFVDAHRREEEQSLQRYRPGGATSSNAPNAPASIFQASSNNLDAETPFGRASSSVGSPVQATAPVMSAGFVPSTRDDFFFIGASVDGDVLPSHALLPNDILTSCLTTPVHISLLWFLVNTRSFADIHPIVVHLLPGVAEDKKTPLGQLRWAFESYTDSIAWTLLPPETFTRLFRQDMVVTNLFRGYLLAHRIISQLSGQVVVYPSMPYSSNTHPLWDSWDVQVDKAMSALYKAVRPSPSKNLSFAEFRDFLDCTSGVSSWWVSGPTAKRSCLTNADVVIHPSFMNEELVTMERILHKLVDQGFHHYTTGGGSEPLPLFERLPLLFQATLVLAHREDAIRLLTRFFDLGCPAVAQGVELNLFSLSLKHLWKHPASVGHRPALMFIYAKAMYVDPTIASDEMRKDMMSACLTFLTKPTSIDDLGQNPSQQWQLATLRQFSLPAGQVTLAASIFAMLAVRSPAIRNQCIQIGVLESCCEAIATCAALTSPQLRPGQTSSLEPHADHRHGNHQLPFDLGPVEETDADVLMKLSLLALLCSLVFNVPLLPAGEINSEPNGGSQNSGSYLSGLMFVSLVEKIIPALRALLYDEAPSVRYAATKAISTLVTHPQLDECDVGGHRVFYSLAMLILDRCEKLPFENNLEVRLEEIGLCFSVLSREERGLTEKVPIDAIKKFMAPQPRGAQSQNAARLSSSEPFHLLSPFSLQPQTPSSSFKAGDSDDDLTAPFPFQAEAGDKCTFPRVVNDSPKKSCRLSRQFPLRLVDVTLSGQKQDCASETVAVLCFALRHLTASSVDQCPVIRAHAGKAVNKLVAANIIPTIQQIGGIGTFVVRGGAASQHSHMEVGSRNSSAIGSFISHFFRTGKGTRPAAQSNKRNQSTPPPASRQARQVAGSESFGGSNRDDDGEEVTLCTTLHSDSSTVFPFVFAVLEYLDAVCLIPPDDGDLRNIQQETLRAQQEKASKAVGGIIEAGCRSRPPQGFDLRFDVIFDKELSEPAKALVFHPIEKYFAVATQTDTIQFFSYDEQRDDTSRQRPMAVFHPSSVVRRWSPYAATGQWANGKLLTGATSGGSSFFDNGSEVDATSEPPLTPHARSFGKGEGGGIPSSIPSNSVASDYSIPVADMFFVDPTRASPIIATVHQNGAICIFGVDVDLASAGSRRKSEEQDVVRIATFQTMPYDHRANSFQCVATYHNAAQQFHVSSPDGSISTWDIVAEQMTNVHTSATCSESITSASISITNSPTALCSHPFDPFIFGGGCNSTVSLFDVRSQRTAGRFDLFRNCGASFASRALCLHVGFSMRSDNVLSAGFSADSVVVAWDRRFPNRPFVVSCAGVQGSDAHPNTTSVGSIASTPQTETTTAKFAALHPLHPDMVSFVVNKSQILLSEYSTNSRKRFRIKQPSCCVFHPLTVLCGLGTGNKVQLYSRKLFNTNMAHEVLHL